MQKFTTSDCVAFLSGLSTPLIDQTKAATRLPLTHKWTRLRKYKDTDLVKHDFLNAMLPVVLTVAETLTGLILVNERPYCTWEAKFSDTPWSRLYTDGEGTNAEWCEEEGFDQWQNTVMWPSCWPSHFAFGYYHNGGTTEFIFQPRNAPDHAPYDQSLPLKKFAPNLPKGHERSECVWVFQGATQEVIDALISQGFVYDESMNSRWGSAFND